MREKICGAQLVLTKRVSQLTVPAETENTSRRQRPLQLSMQRRIAVTPSIQLRSEQTTFDQQTARHLVARAMLRDQEPARPLHVWSSLSRYSFPGFKAVFSTRFSPATRGSGNSTCQPCPAPYFFNELFSSHRCFSTSASLSRQAVSLTALQPPLKLTALTVTRARARTATPGTLATNPHSHPQKCVGPWDASIYTNYFCVGPRTRATPPYR